MKAERAALALLFLITVGPASARAQTMSLTKPGQPARCDTLEMNAEEMTCDNETCALSGAVHLACEGLAVWADEVDIALGPERSFAGAVARGHVLLVERNTVLTCQRLTLAKDRVQGRVDTATFRIKRVPLRRDQRGVPTSRDQVVFSGDFERRDAKNLHVDNATFTMCDCGDDPPSWILEANEIDATLGERATLWWPQPRFNAFGLGMVPGPPLFPLSLALGDRATGMLPPEVKFLGGGFWPTIDLPVFIPIGRSWDVTLTPGMRFDWGTHHLTPVSSWGAPRLATRVRYAPHASTHGELRVGWTLDRKHRAAWQAAAKAEVLPTNQADLDDYIDANGITHPIAQLLGRQELVHRVNIEVEHRTDFTDELTWLVAAEWLSDDLMTTDFRVNLEDQVANYTPSRTQLLFRRPGVVGTLAADYLLALGNSLVPGASPIEYDFSNVGEREADIGHRGPHIGLALLPWRIGAGLHVDADVSFVRYGPWNGSRAPDRVIGGATAGLSYLERIGPVSLRAAAHLDTLWIDPTTAASDVHATAIIDAAASLRLARAYTDVVHVIEPRLTYRALPWLSSDVSGTLDPRFDRRELHQLAVELEQTWWQSKPLTRRMARFTLSQPVDLMNGDVLQTQARMDAAVLGLGLSAWVDIDVPDGMAVEEVGARVSGRWRWFTAGGEWARWTPGADRFRRTSYELGAAGPALADAAWVHMVGGRFGADFGRVVAAYNADYLLPVEAIDCPLPAGTVDRVEQCRATGQRVAGFTRHVVSMAYRSPCDCWELGANVSIPASAPADFRAQVTIAIGGYRVGN